MARLRKPLAIRLGPESKRPIPPQEEVLGRNLAAAFIAMQQVSVWTMRKKHVDEPVGEFWISPARMVIEHYNQTPALPTRTPPTIQ